MGVLIDAALIQRTRLGGSLTTRNDGSEPGVVHEALIAARAARNGHSEEPAEKKARVA